MTSSTASQRQGRLSHGGAAAVLVVPGPTPAHASGKEIRYRRVRIRPCGGYAGKIRDRGNRYAKEVASAYDAAAPTTPPRLSLTPPRLSLAPPKPRSGSEFLVSNAPRRPSQNRSLDSSSSTTPPPPPPPLDLTLSFPVSRPIILFHALAPGDYVRNIPRRDSCGFERPAWISDTAATRIFSRCSAACSLCTSFPSAMMSFLWCYLIPWSHLTWEHTRGHR
ncbi:hypothetical protein Fmac_022050 [Flemingia macrophylla]|uniref:AP2/ERF domain-containing protein n=1 Tax=Flemingia macrophylla TaxID=520843 RepID=A0ABD1LZ81_9FABA